MVRYDHIKIFQCAYLLTVEIYRTTSNFGREYKFTLGEKIKDAAHDVLDLIMKANALPDTEKQKYFSEIDYKKENLRVYLRIACDLKQVSPGRLGAINEKIEEVGRQLGGWQRWAAKK